MRVVVLTMRQFMGCVRAWLVLSQTFQGLGTPPEQAEQEEVWFRRRAIADDLEVSRSIGVFILCCPARHQGERVGFEAASVRAPGPGDPSLCQVSPSLSFFPVRLLFSINLNIGKNSET